MIVERQEGGRDEIDQADLGADTRRHGDLVDDDVRETPTVDE
ncbi:MAG TPA: hypothetical protein VIM10_13640 [Actinopolymorphaceae bacterium]